MATNDALSFKQMNLDERIMKVQHLYYTINIVLTEIYTSLGSCNAGMGYSNINSGIKT